MADDLINQARRCAKAVYLATDAEVASDIARILNGLVAENERLKVHLEDATSRADAWANDWVALNAAVGGLSPEAVEWAIRIAAELMAEWEEGSTHADTYYIVEAWWRSCPPEVRAQILKQGEQ